MKDNSFFYKLIANINDADTARKVFQTILSPDETDVIADRVMTALMIEDGNYASDIAAATNGSAIVMNKIRSLLTENDISFHDIAANPVLNQYTAFAEIYDSLTENVEYEKRANYIVKLLQKYEKNPSLILDLGCGTGSITTLLAKKGYNMIGVDLSEEMLKVAKSKSDKYSLDILYLNQPMQDFELYGTVEVVLCLLDSINYLTEEYDVEKTFKLVHNYLDPGGLFIFDINTAYKLKYILAGNTFCGENKGAFYTWESFFDPDEAICEYLLNFFVKTGTSYSRFSESHYQKAYSLSFFKRMLKKCGFVLKDVFNDLSFDVPKNSSDKIFFIAEKI